MKLTLIILLTLVQGSTVYSKTFCSGRIRFGVSEEISRSDYYTLFSAFGYQIRTQPIDQSIVMSKNDSHDKADIVKIEATKDESSHSLKTKWVLKAEIQKTNYSVILSKEIVVGMLTPGFFSEWVSVPLAKLNIKSILKTYNENLDSGFCIGPGSFHRSPSDYEYAQSGFTNSDVSIIIQTSSRDPLDAMPGNLEKKIVAGLTGNSSTLKRDTKTILGKISTTIEKQWFFQAETPGPLKPNIQIKVSGDAEEAKVESVFNQVLESFKIVE